MWENVYLVVNWITSKYFNFQNLIYRKNFSIAINIKDAFIGGGFYLKITTNSNFVERYVVTGRRILCMNAYKNFTTTRTVVLVDAIDLNSIIFYK